MNLGITNRDTQSHKRHGVDTRPERPISGEMPNGNNAQQSSKKTDDKKIRYFSSLLHSTASKNKQTILDNLSTTLSKMNFTSDGAPNKLQQIFAANEVTTALSSLARNRFFGGATTSLRIALKIIALVAYGESEVNCNELAGQILSTIKVTATELTDILNSVVLGDTPIKTNDSLLPTIKEDRNGKLYAQLNGYSVLVPLSTASKSPTESSSTQSTGNTAPNKSPEEEKPVTRNRSGCTRYTIATKQEQLNNLSQQLAAIQPLIEGNNNISLDQIFSEPKIIDILKDLAIQRESITRPYANSLMVAIKLIMFKAYGLAANDLNYEACKDHLVNNGIITANNSKVSIKTMLESITMTPQFTLTKHGGNEGYPDYTVFRWHVITEKYNVAAPLNSQQDEVNRALGILSHIQMATLIKKQIDDGSLTEEKYNEFYKLCENNYTPSELRSVAGKFGAFDVFKDFIETTINPKPTTFIDKKTSTTTQKVDFNIHQNNVQPLLDLFVFIHKETFESIYKFSEYYQIPENIPIVTEEIGRLTRSLGAHKIPKKRTEVEFVQLIGKLTVAKYIAQAFHHVFFSGQNSQSTAATSLSDTIAAYPDRYSSQNTTTSSNSSSGTLIAPTDVAPHIPTQGGRETSSLPLPRILFI